MDLTASVQKPTSTPNLPMRHNLARVHKKLQVVWLPTLGSECIYRGTATDAPSVYCDLAFLVNSHSLMVISSRPIAQSPIGPDIILARMTLYVFRKFRETFVDIPKLPA